MRDWITANHAQLHMNACNFGGKVQGPKFPYMKTFPKSITNEGFFRNWASQAGMAIKTRATMTERLMGGDDVDPHRCLFINPDIPNLGDILKDMAQPEWEDSTGKFKVDKQPHGVGVKKPESPDFYDGTVLAFSSDARLRGLKQPA